MNKFLLGAVFVIVSKSSSAACVFNEYGSYCHDLIPNYNGTGWAYLAPIFATQYFYNLQQAYLQYQLATYGQIQREIDFNSEYKQGQESIPNNDKSSNLPPNITYNQTYNIKGPTDIRNTDFDK